MSTAPNGRKLLRIEARNTQTPIERKPEWIKTRAHMGPEYTKLRSLVAKEGLHTVCVARDDLDDEGAWLYAETISQVHQLNPGVGVEMLAPDFSGHAHLLNQVFETRPEVFAHNLETVPRIFKQIRPAFRYDRSLDVITQARDFGLITKSNLILGMGETREEISQALVDLRGAGCDLITITQYLRPTAKHHPVVRWVKPNEFVELSKEAEEIGFLGVMSGPLVRSSYRAGRLYNQAMAARAVK